MNQKKPPEFKDYLVLILAVMGISFAAPLIRFSLDGGATIFATAFWRILIGSVFVIIIGKPWMIRASKKVWIASVLGGVFMALHFLTWIWGIGQTNIAVSVVLVTTTPIWVVIFDALFYHTRQTKRVLLGICFAIAGASIVAFSGARDEESTILGIALSIIAAMFAGIYMLYSRTAMEEISTWQTISIIFPVSMFIILLASPVFSQPLVGFQPQVWFAFITMGLLSQILGHGGILVSIKNFSATTSATAVLFEPAGAAIIAYFMFGEVVPVFVYPGALLVAIGVWLTSKAK